MWDGGLVRIEPKDEAWFLGSSHSPTEGGSLGKTKGGM